MIALYMICGIVVGALAFWFGFKLNKKFTKKLGDYYQLGYKHGYEEGRKDPLPIFTPKDFSKHFKQGDGSPLMPYDEPIFMFTPELSEDEK